MRSYIYYSMTQFATIHEYPLFTKSVPHSCTFMVIPNFYFLGNNAGISNLVTTSLLSLYLCLYNRFT